MTAVPGATTIVVGGGILGATTACELARAGMDVLLLEARRFGQQSTGKSAATVRGHYSNPEVVRMAVHSRETLRRLPILLECDPVYTQTGWLFLVDEENAGHEGKTAAKQVVRQFSADIALVTEELADKVFRQLRHRGRIADVAWG